ncbi:MAG: hypothetical protein RL217_213 [Pseudomonadota bacterium]|jgi:methyl-accepting chemotaxis protein
MKNQSLTLKLFIASLGIVALMALMMVWRSYEGISDLSTKLTSATERNLSAAVVSRLQAESLAYGEQIAGYINSAYRIPRVLQRSIEGSIESKHPLSRDQLNDLVEAALANNPDISASYAQFEANGYDGKDADFVGRSAKHTNTQLGTVDIYWRRLSADKIVQESIAVNDKYLDKRNEFGVRESEWYLCSRDSKRPCIMEPYPYEVSGEHILLTSLVMPIIVNQKFHGIVGVDIELPLFKTLVEQLNQNLYGGQAKVTLLSPLGLIIASSHYQDKQLRPLTEAMPQLGETLKSLHIGSGLLESDDSLYLSKSIKIPTANSQWSLLIELPKSVAMAELVAQQEMARAEITQTLWGQMIAGFLLSALSMIAIVTLLRSITQPLNTLNSQIAQLASADGDLSKRLDLDTHSELISLGSNFNRFMEKLREMVLSLKEIGQQVRAEAKQNLSVSDQANQATADQQSEIDNVVTATQEMSATAQEVARIAADVSSHTKDIHTNVTGTQTELAKAADASASLSTNMHGASDAIRRVSNRSEDINRILVVIGSIAEQTNLLALNAAIEAARAGEQGRGFAVVADEVRTLASRTQSSTTEINTMIQELQHEVEQAVAIINSGSQQASQTMNITRTAYESLNQVVEAITNITDNIRQVATAAEEQSAVSEDITKNLTIIGDAARTLASLGEQASHSSANVTSQVDKLDRQLGALRT